MAPGTSAFFSVISVSTKSHFPSKARRLTCHSENNAGQLGDNCIQNFVLERRRRIYVQKFSFKAKRERSSKT